MDDDQPKRPDTDNAHDPRATSDDLDAQAILARRKMFVASALAGMSLGAASCEAQVSGSVSGSVSTGGSANTGGSSGAVATPVTGGSNANDQGAVVAQPCLMVAATPEDASTSASSADAGHINVMPCLMVASPEFFDSGVRADARTQPSLPQIGVSMPCLSMPAPQRDSGVLVAPCLRMAVPRDAGVTADARAVDASTGGAVRDASVRVPTPQPCLEMAVPRACLRYAQPPVRKDKTAAHEFNDPSLGADDGEDE